ncbi:MAG TPA: hypothetical protein VGD47_01895 [Steroidobacteraceae bacterium]
MDTLLSTFLREVTCGAGATLITLLLSATIVQSTAVAPGTHATNGRVLAQQPTHAWFGQPEPAVLVD